MENEKIVVSPKRSSSLLYAASTAVSCLIMLDWVFFSGSVSGFFKVVFSVAAVVFVYGTVFWIKRFVDPKPLITADESGFTDNSRSDSFGFVPWSDVKDIYIITVNSRAFFKHKLIQIELTNTEEYLNRLSAFSRRAAEMNLRMGYQAVCFSLSGTDKDPDKFYEELRTLWEEGR